MKIGVFGGTFNPIHIGHTSICDSVANEFELDRVFFVPDRVPVHKMSDSLASVEDRCQMINLAICGYDRFELSRVEVDRDEDSYIYLTVDYFCDKFSDDDIYLIIGWDSYLYLEKWKKFEDFIKKINIIVMKRDDDRINEALSNYEGRIYFASNREFVVSSTKIRDLLTSDGDVSSMIDSNVERYIKENGVYIN